MKKLAVIVAGLALATTVGAASKVHFSLLRSAPAKDQKLEVTTAPTRLQLWFSEVPAAPASQVALKRDTADVAIGKIVVVEKDKSLYVDSAKPLEVGAYTLTWRAAGDDGHVMSGEVKFAVVPKSRP